MVFRMDRKHAALLQLGIAIVAIILFIGVLNSVVYSYRTPLVTTEGLWQHAKNVLVALEFRSADNTAGQLAVHNLSAVGVYHDGYLYISIPYPANLPVLRSFRLFPADVDGGPLTVSRLIESGANWVHVYYEPINSTAVAFRPHQFVSPLWLRVVRSGESLAFSLSGSPLYVLDPSQTASEANDAVKWRTLFPDGGRFNRTVQLDVGTLVLNGMGLGSERVALQRIFGEAQNLRGLKLKLEIYGVSQKPVLKALTEPIYSFFAALYATLLAVVRRVKQYAASAFGGFASSFTLTGLIGDPVTALILTMVFVTVVFLVIKKK